MNKTDGKCTAKWLSILFSLHVAGIVNSLISNLTAYDGAWVSRIITAGVILCLFLLGYRWAAIFQAVSLCCTLANVLISYLQFYRGVEFATFENMAGGQ